MSPEIILKQRNVHLVATKPDTGRQSSRSQLVVLAMFDKFESNGSNGESEQVRALKRLAFMYHAAGKYDKAEELLEVIDQWNELQRQHESRRRRVDDRDAA